MSLPDVSKYGMSSSSERSFAALASITRLRKNQTFVYLKYLQL